MKKRMSKFLLELFSGTGSVGRPWRDKGHRVLSVDLDSRYNPEVCEDIRTWDYKNLEPLMLSGPRAHVNNIPAPEPEPKHLETTS